MTFTLAVVILAALAAVGLGLVVYHLLSRLHVLEGAVQGGLEPPTRRLRREEFEQRFRVAQSRAELAQRFDTGVVLFLDAGSDTSDSIIATLRHLPRHDLVHTVSCDAPTTGRLTEFTIPFIELSEVTQPLSSLGVSTLPFVFVLDADTVRTAKPLGTGDDLLATLAEFT